MEIKVWPENRNLNGKDAVKSTCSQQTWYHSMVIAVISGGAFRPDSIWKQIWKTIMVRIRPPTLPKIEITSNDLLQLEAMPLLTCPACSIQAFQFFILIRKTIEFNIISSISLRCFLNKTANRMDYYFQHFHLMWDRDILMPILRGILNWHLSFIPYFCWPRPREAQQNGSSWFIGD